MRLRPYQEHAIRRLRSAITSGHRRILLVAPTGAGKTLIAREVIAGAVGLSRRVTMVAPRRELVDQCSAALDGVGIDHGIMQSQHWRTRPWLPVQVATTATLMRREMRSPDIMMLDEAHLGLDASIKLVERFAKSIVIGLTATPCRSDGRGIGEIFTELVEAVTPAQLVTDGYLVPTIVYAPSAPDLSGVRTARGDYARGQLASAVDRPHLTGDAVSHWKKLARGRSTIAFAAGIEHSKHLAKAFREAGIDACHVDGSSKSRQHVLGDLRNGTLTVATCADLFTYGIDAPIVSCITVCRPTQSLALHRQMIGRGMRTFKGKSDLLVLDHAGNTNRHGGPCEVIEWTLCGKVRRKSDASPVRTCPMCFRTHRPRPTCPGCGHAYVAVTREPIEQRAGELRLFRHNGWMGGIDRTEWYRRQTKIAKERGYKVGWAAHRYRRMFGEWPRRRSTDPSM